MHLYVYYEVARDEAGATRERVLALQADLGLDARQVRLQKRADSGPGRETWMEVYHDVADDFEARLAATVERHGLTISPGLRHVERFVDFA